MAICSWPPGADIRAADTPQRWRAFVEKPDAAARGGNAGGRATPVERRHLPVLGPRR
jgi:hypothetical protein